MNEFIKPSEVPNTIKSEAPKNKSLHSEAYNVASDKAVASDNVGQILKDNNRDVLVKEVEANFVNIGRKLNQLPASVQAEVISNFKEYADTQSFLKVFTTLKLYWQNNYILVYLLHILNK